MKAINEYIESNLKSEKLVEESKKNPKYVIRYYVKGNGHDYIFCDDWMKEIKKSPINKAKYWDVMLMSVPSLDDIKGLIAWHGWGGFWANKLEDSVGDKNSSRRPKLTKSELEKLESTRK